MTDETDGMGVSDLLAKSIVEAGASLERMWERDRGKAPPEPVEHYEVCFSCTPSVFARIKDCIASERTTNRIMRKYPKPDERKRNGK